VIKQQEGWDCGIACVLMVAGYVLHSPFFPFSIHSSSFFFLLSFFFFLLVACWFILYLLFALFAVILPGLGFSFVLLLLLVFPISFDYASALGKVLPEASEIQELCQTQSIWTIDLAYILKSLDIHLFTFYTSYLGVQKIHANDV